MTENSKNWIECILILAKTYPSPSAKYVETSCIAGINENGIMRRLYPVPFRLIHESQRFKKWQWISVRIQKSSHDNRIESHRIYTDTLNCGDYIKADNHWLSRRPWLDKIPVYGQHGGESLSAHSLLLARPKKVLGLEITKTRYPDWTSEEQNKLMQSQMQGDLFSEIEEKQALQNTLRKIPYDFHYRYVLETPDGDQEYRHKIVDWEAGMLFWKCLSGYRDNWEIPFRNKLESDLAKTDLMFLLGNMHRFQNQWLIISLIYPLRQKPGNQAQLSLFG